MIPGMCKSIDSESLGTEKVGIKSVNFLVALIGKHINGERPKLLPDHLKAAVVDAPVI